MGPFTNLATMINWTKTRNWTDAEYIAYWKSKCTVTANGCWEAHGRQSQSKGRPAGSPGYVQLSFRGKRYQAHRLIHTLLIGPIPEGHVVAHRCDNPPCFNPDHLFACTETVNMRDAGTKRRWPRQYRDTCINGHPRTPENTVRHGKEQKLHCRVCVRETGRREWRENPENRERRRQYRARRKAERGASEP